MSIKKIFNSGEQNEADKAESDSLSRGKEKFAKIVRKVLKGQITKEQAREEIKKEE